MNNTKVWHGFSLDDLFIICRGNAKNINSKKDEGDVSLISAKDNNNGFNKNVIPTSKETIYKNVYTVNNNGNGVCLSYYHEYPLIASSDVTILKPKYDKFCNISVALFITTLIRQQKSKFNYGYKMSESRVKKQKILLPGKTFYGSIRHGLPHETKRSGARKHLHLKYDGTDYGVHYRLPLCRYE